MSPSQEFANLRQKLERWKSHNEVHAKPADAVLYEFLSALLNLADHHEELAQSEDIAPPIPEELGVDAPEDSEENPLPEKIANLP